MSPIAVYPASYYHCDIILIMTSRAYGTRSPRSHYDLTLIVTSFATELATTTVKDVSTYVTYGHVYYIKMLGKDIFETATDAVDIKRDGRILQDAMLLNSYIGPVLSLIHI